MSILHQSSCLNLWRVLHFFLLWLVFASPFQVLGLPAGATTPAISFFCLRNLFIQLECDQEHSLIKVDELFLGLLSYTRLPAQHLSGPKRVLEPMPHLSRDSCQLCFGGEAALHSPDCRRSLLPDGSRKHPAAIPTWSAGNSKRGRQLEILTSHNPSLASVQCVLIFTVAKCSWRTKTY